MTDTGLIDEAAYARAVERYAPLVAARCGRAIPGADADDAVQAVFLVLWRRRDEAPAEGPALASWLYRTTGFVIKRARRDRARRRTAEERAASPEVTTMDRPATLSDMERAEARRLIDDALASLPAPEREAVLLSQLAGHSYAEVAAQQGCAKATVAARVKQGLDALRRRLVARGCALSLVGLTALLGDEAQAAVPDALNARVHRLPRVAMAGTTAAVVGARILQWSTRESPIVKIIVAVGAAALCVATLFIATHGAAADQPASPAVAAPSASPPETDEQRVDRVARALRADVGFVMRWRRPLDTWRGIVASPVGAMLPPTVVESVAAELAGLEDIQLRFDPMSAFDPAELDVLYLKGARAQIEGPEAQLRMVREQQQAMAEGRELPEMSKSMPTFDQFPGYRADLVVRVADDATAERWRARIADGFGGRIAWAPGEAGALVSAGTDCSLAFTASGHDLVLRMRTTWNDGDLAWLQSSSGDADVTMRALIRPRDPAAYAALMEIDEQAEIETGRLAFWIERGRFRMSAATMAAVGPQKEQFAKLGTLAPAVWDRVPAQALVAGACAVRGGDMFSGMIMETMLTTMFAAQNLEAPELLAALRAIGADADGAFIGYVEPVGAMPALTVALATSPAASAALVGAVATLLGQTPTDGIVRIPAMPFLFQLGYGDGHLVCISHPAGVAAFVVHGPGFVALPDVAASLAATGEAPAMARMLVRTDKLIDLAVPLAAASGLEQAEIAGMEEASRRLAEEREAGWMVLRADQQGMRAEASGVAAVIAAIAAASAGAAAGLTGVN